MTSTAISSFHLKWRRMDDKFPAKLTHKIAGDVAPYHKNDREMKEKCSNRYNADHKLSACL